jgi:hypothetical protein
VHESNARVDGSHVRSHLTTILADPLEARVDGRVELTPRELLREEEVASGEAVGVCWSALTLVNERGRRQAHRQS